MGYWLVERRPGSADDATPAMILLTNWCYTKMASREIIIICILYLVVWSYCVQNIIKIDRWVLKIFFYANQTRKCGEVWLDMRFGGWASRQTDRHRDRLIAILRFPAVAYCTYYQNEYKILHTPTCASRIQTNAFNEQLLCALFIAVQRRKPHLGATTWLHASSTVAVVVVVYRFSDSVVTSGIPEESVVALKITRHRVVTM